MDLVTYVKSIPKIGETVFGKKLIRNPGGKGVNQADAIAKLGSKVVLIGCVGVDDRGHSLNETLQKDGVDIFSCQKSNRQNNRNCLNYI